jgi:GNAT superfamily N-acetyltransferase
MSIQIVEESVSVLPDYGTVSPAFLVEARFAVDPIEGGLGGLRLRLEQVQPPYVKDYDRENGHDPEWWLEQWKISRWGVQSAFKGEVRVGGAIIAWNTPEILMLDGRKDLAVLWDIRVHADYRNKGIGSALFSASTSWARARGCIQLKIETQNVNVPACHFYARQGCRLVAINPYAYVDLPQEVQFIWLLDL